MHIAGKSVAVLVSGLMVALFLLAPPAVQSSETDRLTHFMVNQNFEVPGKVLQANTRYVIKLHDLYQNRNVVQVYTDDQKQMLTQFLAINDERMEPVDNTTFTFIETQPGYPKPIRSWFYPGRNIGLEFVYPKEQALEIAKHAREPILTTETAVNLHDLGSVTVTAQEPITGDFGTTATAQATPPPSEEVESGAISEAPVEEEETQIAQAEPTQPSTEEQVTMPEPQPAPGEPEPSVSEEQAEPEPVQTAELPRTAGELPLVALIGMLSIGLGLALKALAVRS
jgi:hypothetical protein